jgi:hypothetical protein
MEINMTYAIIGTGGVGTTLARFFAAKDIPVLMANSRGRGGLVAEKGRLVNEVAELKVNWSSAVGERKILDADVGPLWFFAVLFGSPLRTCSGGSSPARPLSLGRCIRLRSRKLA